jgi:hypothetical protein
VEKVVEEKSAANNDNNNHHRLLLATHHARLRASLSPSLSRSRARARYSLADLPCSLAKPLILVWGKPNRQNAIFVRF